jgi:peptide/nickel transport system substrate-binding protein
MSKLRVAVGVVSIAAVATFGVAAWWQEERRRVRRRRDQRDDDVVPDYVDPQLSYTLEGWEVLWNTYTPLLTYKHQKGDPGTDVVPGLAKDMPDISPDGKTYKLTLRPNMKYSDGTLIKASDFTYAIKRLFKADSGGSVFYEGIIGAKDFATASRTPSAVSRPMTPPATSPSRWRIPTARSTTSSA